MSHPIKVKQIDQDELHAFIDALINSGIQESFVILQPAHLTGNESLSGQKTFLHGAFGPMPSGTGQYIPFQTLLDYSGEASGNFVTTGQTGNFATTGYVDSGYVRRDESGQFAPSAGTGSFITTGQTGAFAPASQTGSFITTGQTGAFASAAGTGSFITTGQTGAFASAAGTGDFITTGQTGDFAPAAGTGSFITTGQTGQFYSTGNPSGFTTTGIVDVYYYPRTNPSGYAQTGWVDSGYYPRSNPSGYIRVSDAWGVTGIQVTGSSSISGQVNFSGSGNIAASISGQNVIIYNVNPPIGQIYFTGNAVATVVGATNTLYLASGTYSTGYLDRFQLSGLAIRYIGSNPIVAHVSVSAAVNNVNNSDTIIALRKNGSTLGLTRNHQRSKDGGPMTMSLDEIFQFSTGDYVELMVGNATTTNNITVYDSSILVS